jgi:predicted DNA-binding transcriptional regulator AlpA
MTQSIQSPYGPQGHLADASALIPLAQVAASIGIDVITAHEWIRTGEIPGAVTLKGRAWVRTEALDAWLDATRGGAAVRHPRPVQVTQDT